MLKYKLYLGDILRAIEQIEKSLKGKDLIYFKKDFDVGEATAMRMQIIGESIYKLPDDLKKKYNDVNWIRFVSFRNTISHAYFVVDKDMLWNAKDELPKLKRTVRRMLNEE